MTAKATAIKPLRSLLSFPLEDAERGNKILIGSILILAGFVIPLIPLIFVYGYGLRIMRQSAQGEESALPAWDDWGELGLDGLKGMLLTIVYLLPGLIVLIGGMVLYFASVFSIPLLGAVSTAAESDGAAAALALLPIFSLGGIFLFFLSIAIGWLLLLLGLIPLPFATAHFLSEGSLSAGFRLGEIWSLVKANKWGLFAAWIVSFGLISLIYLVFFIGYYSICLACLTPLVLAPVQFYAMTISGALFGQAYHESAAVAAG
jgi:hypothetical protein